MLFAVYFATTVLWTSGSSADINNHSHALLELLADLLKIVMPFYFGVTAAEKIWRNRSNSQSELDPLGVQAGPEERTPYSPDFR